MHSRAIIPAAIIMMALSLGTLLLIIGQRAPVWERTASQSTDPAMTDALEAEATPDNAERPSQALASVPRPSIPESSPSTPTFTQDGSSTVERDSPSEVTPSEQGAKLFVIIDDVGYSLEDLSQFLALDIPLTFAILPNLEHSLSAVQLIAQHGHQYILHLPMEPLDRSLTDPQAILVSDSDQVIRDKIMAMTASLPNIQGVNNHMGSRASSDERIMRILFKQLKVQDLFFVNSLTSANTIRRDMADEIGLAYLERHFFLDHVTQPQSIAMALAKGAAQALTNGEAILIGHVSVKATARIIANYVQSSDAQQVTFDYIANHDNFRN